jgi:hypothetical protein
MTDLNKPSEFSNTGHYNEADYYQDAHYSTNIYPYQIQNQTKMEPFESEFFNKIIGISVLILTKTTATFTTTPH